MRADRESGSLSSTQLDSGENILRRVAHLTVAVLVAVGFAAIGVGTANADIEECRDGHICTWQRSQFRGQIVEHLPPGPCVNIRGSSASPAYSAMNRTSATHIFYSDSECEGSSIILEPGESLANFSIRSARTA
jgi:hypothetical protein